MITGRSKKPITLSEEEREQLSAIVNSRSLPHGLVRRARIVMMAAEGVSNNTIAERLGLSHQTVCQWRKRYLQEGLAGLHDEIRPGRPRTISDEEVASLVRKTIQTKPENGTHWTIRTVANETGLSRPTVHRIWRAFGLQPHRQRHFKLSTDPFFVEKVRDIVGLYLNPPDKAMVLCVDEKTRYKHLTAPSHYCLWDLDTLKVSLMITYVMAPPPSLQRWTLQPGRYSLPAKSGTAIKSTCSFSKKWMPMCHLI